MDKKLLIVLQGIGGNGKTTVLKKLLTLLLKDNQMINFETESGIQGQNIKTYPFPGDPLSVNAPNPDISPTVITFRSDKNCVKVGIASAGDYEGTVEKNLKFFKNKECNIMFCATKSYGNTVKCIHSHLDNNPETILLPFYKSENNSTNWQTPSSKLAQEMLIVAKMRWNTINQSDFVFS